MCLPSWHFEVGKRIIEAALLGAGEPFLFPFLSLGTASISYRAYTPS